MNKLDILIGRLPEHSEKALICRFEAIAEPEYSVFRTLIRKITLDGELQGEPIFLFYLLGHKRPEQVDLEGKNGAMEHFLVHISRLYCEVLLDLMPV